MAGQGGAGSCEIPGVLGSYAAGERVRGRSLRGSGGHGLGRSGDCGDKPRVGRCRWQLQRGLVLFLPAWLLQ